MEAEFQNVLQEEPLQELLLKGFAVLQGQNYQAQVVDVLRAGFSKDILRQKNAWSLTFLPYGQIGKELVPYLISRGQAASCPVSFGYGKYFPKKEDQLDHDALYQLFFSNSAAFEYKTDKGPVKLVRVVQELQQLPKDLKQSALAQKKKKQSDSETLPLSASHSGASLFEHRLDAALESQQKVQKQNLTQNLDISNARPALFNHPASAQQHQQQPQQYQQQLQQQQSQQQQQLNDPSMSAAILRIENSLNRITPPDNHTLQEIFGYLQAINKQLIMITRRVASMEESQLDISNYIQELQDRVTQKRQKKPLVVKKQEPQLRKKRVIEQPEEENEEDQ